MKNPLAITVVTALLASVLFLLVFSLGMGFLFMFLPTLPLFIVGFGKSSKIALDAGMLASFIIAVLTGGFSAPVMFFIAFAVPCWAICFLLRHHYDIQIKDQNSSNKTTILQLWYPVGLVVMYLAIYACVFLAIITALMATQEANLPQLMAAQIQAEINNIQKDYDMALDISPSSLSFMLCGFFAWLWVVFLYAHAWVANYALIKKSLAVRPTLMVTPFFIPHWFLTLLGICAIASMIGGESMRFLAKSSLIILMLPYFFQGIGILHIGTMRWANRRIFLFFVYFSIVTLFWPAFILAGIGLWHHVKLLNKLLSLNGKSSKS